MKNRFSLFLFSLSLYSIWSIVTLSHLIKKKIINAPRGPLKHYIYCKNKEYYDNKIRSHSNVTNIHVGKFTFGQNFVKLEVHSNFKRYILSP
jgi:hypothetical protein